MSKGIDSKVHMIDINFDTWMLCMGRIYYAMFIVWKKLI